MSFHVSSSKSAWSRQSNFWQVYRNEAGLLDTPSSKSEDKWTTGLLDKKSTKLERQRDDRFDRQDSTKPEKHIEDDKLTDR